MRAAAAVAGQAPKDRAPGARCRLAPVPQAHCRRPAWKTLPKYQGLSQESSAAFARQAAKDKDAGLLYDVATAALLDDPGALQSVFDASTCAEGLELLVGELG